MDAWVYRLRDAYEAGYYRTEAAEGGQTGFPWQNKACRDCPFWAASICQVYAEYRSPTAHTCAYFDAWNRSAGESIIRERRWRAISRWWEWFNGGAPR